MSRIVASWTTPPRSTTRPTTPSTAALTIRRSGRVVDDSIHDAATEGIRQFNRRLFSLQEYKTVIVPLRDGVAISRREG